MILVFFFYGLAFFTMGLAVALESRRASELPLGRHLPWLAAFGLVHSLVEWADMALLLYQAGPLHDVLFPARRLLLPLSALLLVRFGAGLAAETGPLPRWLSRSSVVVLVPLSLLAAYILVLALTADGGGTAADVWSRYLLYLPGNLLAAWGLLRQRRGLARAGLAGTGNSLLGAALAFGLNALVAGLIVPAAPFGLAPWLNYDRVLTLTGVPVQVWRASAALAVMVFVVRTLGLFEAERSRKIAALEEERARAQRAFLEVEARARETAERWTEGLVSISRWLTRAESAEQVLPEVVDLARRLLAADAAALALWDQSGERLELKCYSTSSGVHVIDSTVVDWSPVPEIVRGGTGRLWPGEGRDTSARWFSPVLNKEILTAVIAPLELEGEAMGGLWAARYAADPFTPTDLLGLERLADQAVIALQHARMAERLRSLAVVEERERIAREMHDGLAQVLGYLNLKASLALEHLARGASDQVEASLLELKQVAREAYTDTREAIFSLRQTPLENSSLLPALQQYLSEYQAQYGINARLIVEDGSLQELPPAVEIQIIRVIQEALTNVRKHARASTALVRFSRAGGQVQVSVEDDGQGFDRARVMGETNRYFGLQIMRERVESVGGTIEIDSQPGRGTRVFIRLPWRSEQKR